MTVVWVPRSQWGATSATEAFIAGRSTIPADKKVSVHVHHTAAIDVDDATPNRWDYDEAQNYMRRLQWVRPDLGPLPYSDNLAVSEDLETVWFFEGRGALVQGAHTRGYNYRGYGVGVFGNFNLADTDAAKVAVDAIEWRVSQLRDEGLTNLGSLKNPQGWNVWGHRDTSSKTCPGHSLYPLLADFQLGDPDMTMIVDALKAQNMAYYRTLKQRTGSPGGNAEYWGSDYPGGGPSDAEWVAAADELFTASLKAGVMGSSVDSGDVNEKIAVHAANPDAHHA